MPATWSEQKIYIGKINHLGSENLVKEILADKTNQDFRRTLARLVERVREENRVLAFDDASTIPQIAWASRNLAELRILARFVCRSQANLERFNNDIFTTGPGTLESLLQLSNNIAKEAGSPMRASPHQYRRAARMKQARVEAGLGKESPLMAGMLAARVGLEKEYQFLSRVTSPLIHPSAISVLRTFDLESYRQSLTILGLKLVTDVILDARSHIGKHGFRPEK